MNLPFFYEAFLPDEPSFSLSEDTSKHVIQVLRMKKGEELRLTNGKGDTYLVQITEEQIVRHQMGIERKAVA